MRTIASLGRATILAGFSIAEDRDVGPLVHKSAFQTGIHVNEKERAVLQYLRTGITFTDYKNWKRALAIDI